MKTKDKLIWMKMKSKITLNPFINYKDKDMIRQDRYMKDYINNHSISKNFKFL